MQQVVERVTSGLDHVRAFYYAEFRAIIFKQAKEAVETGDPYAAIQHLHNSLGTLGRWALGAREEK